MLIVSFLWESVFVSNTPTALDSVLGHVCTPLVFLIQGFKKPWTTQISGTKQQA